MKVSELMERLGKYNPDADVDVVANNKGHEFSFAYGNSEGCTIENCETVSLWVDSLNDGGESAG